MLLFCFLGALTIIQTLHAENTYEAKVRLESTLFKGYRKESRPVLEYKDNVTITFGISLNHIKDMDDKNQILTLSLWIRQKWYDPRLKWQPSNFSLTNTTNINPDKLWIPDLTVYNEVNRRLDSGMDQFRTKAIVHYSGKITWMAPTVVQLSCHVDVKYFPYDTQTCKMKIGSWTYDGFAVDIKPESYTMDVSKSPSNPEWELVSTSVQRNVGYYPCCPEPYPDVTYTITIKRRVQSYWVNFFVPGILLTMMTMMAFVTPASDTGERVGLVLTSLVSMFVFLKMVNERTPTSDTVPLLSIYFLMLSFEIGLIFYSVCVSLNAYHKNTTLGDMPNYVRSLVLKKLGNLWGLRKDGEDIRKKLEALRNLSLMKDEIRLRLEKMKSVVPNPKRASENTESRSRHVNNEILVEDSTNKDSFIASSDQILNETQFSGSTGTTHREGNLRSDVREQGKISQSRASLTGGECMELPCSCPSLIQSMVKANKRLLACIREIVYVACQFDKTSSGKEHWLLAAVILDRAFLVLFVLLFLAFTFVNFFW